MNRAATPFALSKSLPPAFVLHSRIKDFDSHIPAITKVSMTDK